MGLRNVIGTGEQLRFWDSMARIDMGLRMSLALESSSYYGTQWTKRDSGYFRVPGTLDRVRVRVVTTFRYITISNTGWIQ